MKPYDFTVNFELNRAQNPTMLTDEEVDAKAASGEYETATVEFDTWDWELSVKAGSRKARLRCPDHTERERSEWLHGILPELYPFTCRQIVRLLGRDDARVTLCWLKGLYDPQPLS